jgi:hypothetical protein
VLPTVSPIVEKHLLVLPKKHINTMKQLSDNEKQMLVVLVKNIIELFNGEYFLFEHGAFPDNGNTCGVDHAHIHILSIENKIARTIIDFVKNTYVTDSYPHLISSLNDKNDKPYLLFGNDYEGMCCCNNTIFPSQFMRKILCDNLGIIDWNWRLMNNWRYFHNVLLKLQGKIYI